MPLAGRVWWRRGDQPAQVGVKNAARKSIGPLLHAFPMPVEPRPGPVTGDGESGGPKNTALTWDFV